MQLLSAPLSLIVEAPISAFTVASVLGCVYNSLARPEMDFCPVFSAEEAQASLVTILLQILN